MSKLFAPRKTDKNEILRTHDYRGFKIVERRNRKTGRIEFKTRFQINNRRHYLTGNKKSDLQEMIDEIVYQERRLAKDLPVPEPEDFPPVAEILNKYLSRLAAGSHRRAFCERIFKTFLALLPEKISAKRLARSHFQSYIDLRFSQTGVQSGLPLAPATVKKELSAIRAALREGELYFAALEKWQPPPLPPVKAKKNKRATILDRRELVRLLAALRAPRAGKQTETHVFHRRRLADELEFKLETGLRRKEVAALEKRQYDAAERALRNVKRFKTDSVTAFLPLSIRASEIVEKRLTENSGRFIFSAEGAPNEGDYRTLKNICENLGIEYGRWTSGGFVPHDLRHSFASEVIPHTDIKTAQELLGHARIEQTGDYIHTNERRLKEAIRRRDGFDASRELVALYKQARRRKITAKKFVAAVRKIFEN